MSFNGFDHAQQDSQRFQIRLLVALFCCLVLSGLLIYRYFVLQVVRYTYFHTQAEANRISLVPVPPSRGLILDSKGVVLAHNYSAYTLEITPDNVENIEGTITELSKILPITNKDKKRFYKLMAESKDFVSFPIRTKLSDEEVARFAAQAWRFPGVEIQARLFRNYPHGESASHLIGYIGRISDKDKLALSAGCTPEGTKDATTTPCLLPNYKGTDHIGKMGLEQSYESELHGKTGYAEVETDANNRAVRTLRRTAPEPGNNIQLSVDIKLQQYIEKMFNGRRGSLVAIDPRNGGILAMVSLPGFDPNLFVDGIDPDNWKALNDNPDHPLTNRATRGTYPPGSTFKPFMAMAALHAGVRTPKQSISDPGYFILPGAAHQFRDDKPGGHGSVDMHKSIVASCDTYYYKLAWDMGIDRIHEQLKPFGFGQLTGVDLAGELNGILPSKQWKQKRFSRYPANVQKWYAGDVVSIGIGQGYNSYTPIQLAQATAIIASRGKVFHPHLVHEIQPVNGGKPRLVEPRPLTVLNRKTEDWDLVQQAMVDVVKNGTATGISHGLKYNLAGKTGTAQVYSLKGAKYSASSIHEKLRDHSWFIAFAPAEKPTIALAVIVENGGFGATAAAPLARKTIDYYLLGPEAAGPAVPPVDTKSKKPKATASAASAMPAKEEHQHAGD